MSDLLTPDPDDLDDFRALAESYTAAAEYRADFEDEERLLAGRDECRG